MGEKTIKLIFWRCLEGLAGVKKNFFLFYPISYIIIKQLYTEFQVDLIISDFSPLKLGLVYYCSLQLADGRPAPTVGGAGADPESRPEAGQEES